MNRNRALSLQPRWTQHILTQRCLQTIKGAWDYARRTDALPIIALGLDPVRWDWHLHVSLSSSRNWCRIMGKANA